MNQSTHTTSSHRASPYLDELETRAPEARERALMERLPAHLQFVIEHSPGWRKLLSGTDPRAVTSRQSLASLPVLRKPDLKGMQQADPPFGGLTTRPIGELGRLFMSPGPLFEPEHEHPSAQRALWAAGIRRGHVIQNCFGYHLTPGAWMVDSAARAMGCTVIPAGVGQTEQQLELIQALKPDAYTGTPSFLRIIVEKARETGADISALKTALLAAEALPPSLRAWLNEQGIQTVLQWYGTAELGLIAYETAPQEGMVVDEDVVVEIVRPGTGDPVPDGEVGEVVVTTFNRHYPMIRLGTGDLSAIMPGRSPCGRTNARIKGWLGRADQTTKVRGMFVHPGQIDAIVKRHPQLLRARLVVSGEKANDAMTLRAETAHPSDALLKAVADTIRDLTKLRGDVELVAPGALPNDGKLIDDVRSYA